MKAQHGFYAVLFLLCGYFLLIPTYSFAQENTTRYQVAFVLDNDVLNVRSGAGVSNGIVWELPPDAGDIFITGSGQIVDGSLWVPIRQYNQIGWVNSRYLTETLSPKVFCRDARAIALLLNLKTAVERHDGALLASLVNQERGLLLRLNRWNTEVQLTSEEVFSLFTDPTVRNWGSGQGSGLPIDGTAQNILLPLLDGDLLPDDLLSCNQALGGGTTGLLSLPDGYEGINFYSIYRTAPNDENTFDWGAWAVGIEYWNGIPYISFLVHYEWEI